MTKSGPAGNGGGHARRAAPGSRVERIRQAIEHGIVSGDLTPGTKLDESTLAERHGASRTPVREALQRLASQGLIELRTHAGAFVASLSPVELAEMFEALAYMEAACAALAARRHSAEDRVSLAAAHEACARAAEVGDADAFYRVNRQFHACIYEAAHNAYLAAQTLQLTRRLEPYRREATFHPGLMALTMREHERVLQAILDMDEAAAGQHMRGHLDTLRDDVVSVARAAEKAGRA